MNQETLKDFFLDQVRDIYDAEKQLTKALPKMAKAANSEELGEALRHHLEETENQVNRLEEVFRSLGAPAKSKRCAGMKGLIEEGSEHIAEKDPGELRDLAIIAAAQRVEHYEIAAYGTVKALAEQLGNEEAERLLGETQEEEEAADSKLTEIALSIYETPDEEIEGEETEESAVAKGPSRQGGAPVRRTRDASGS